MPTGRAASRSGASASGSSFKVNSPDKSGNAGNNEETLIARSLNPLGSARKMAATLIAGLMQLREGGHPNNPGEASMAAAVGGGREQINLIDQDQMPEKEHMIFSSQLRKGAFYGRGGWRPMFVCINDENLYMAKHESDTVSMDRIPLHEITSVTNAGNVTDIESGAQQTFYALEVVTDKDGHNLGRTYHFQAESEGLHARWLKILNETIVAARNKIDEANKVSSTKRFLGAAKELHDADDFQKFFGAVIMMSFTISLIQTEMVSGCDLGTVRGLSQNY